MKILAELRKGENFAANGQVYTMREYLPHSDQVWAIDENEKTAVFKDASLTEVTA